jgi:hypothetical protein
MNAAIERDLDGRSRHALRLSRLHAATRCRDELLDVPCAAVPPGIASA